MTQQVDQPQGWNVDDMGTHDKAVTIASQGSMETPQGYSLDTVWVPPSTPKKEGSTFDNTSPEVKAGNEKVLNTLTNIGTESKPGFVAANELVAGSAAGNAVQDILNLNPFATPQAPDVAPPTGGHNVVAGQLAGGLAPLALATLIGGPYAGAGVMGAQGAGSARGEGQQEGWSGKQTAAVGVERGIANALFGLIPGSKGVSAFTKIAEALGLNVSQSVFENHLKDDLGIPNKVHDASGVHDQSDWEAFKDTMSDPKVLATSALLPAIGHVVEKLTSEGRALSPSQERKVVPFTPAPEEVKPNASPMSFEPPPRKIEAPQAPLFSLQDIATTSKDAGVSPQFVQREMGLPTSELQAKLDETTKSLEKIGKTAQEGGVDPSQDPIVQNLTKLQKFYTDAVQRSQARDAITPKQEGDKPVSVLSSKVEEQPKGQQDSTQRILQENSKVDEAQRSFGGSILTKPVALYAEPLVDRVERLGNNSPIATEAAQKLRTTFDKIRQIYGENEKTSIPEATKLASRPSKLNSFLFRGETKGDGTYRTSNFVDAIEGRIKPPAGTEGVLATMQKGNKDIFDIQAKGLGTGEQASGSVQRLLTGDNFNIIRHPGTKDWWTMVRAYADVNKDFIYQGKPVTVESTAQHFMDLAKQASSNDYAGVTRAMNQEFRRVFPNVPSQIKGTGGWISLYHDTPFDYFRTATNRVVSRTAFLQTFGKGDEWKQTRTDLHTVNPETGQAFDTTVAQIHGIPTSDGSVAVNQALSKWNTYIGRPLEAIGLSGITPIWHAIETFAGSAPAVYGFKNSLNGFVKALKTGNNQELLNSGKLLRNYMDLSFDPRSPMVSTLKYGETLATELTRLSLAAQDNVHISTAQVWADTLKNKEISAWGRPVAREVLLQLGFGRSVVDDMVNGRGTPEQYDVAVRKSLTYFTGANRVPGEGTSVLASKMFTSLFKYQSFPTARLNAIIRSSRGVIDAVQSGDFNRIQAAGRLWGRINFSLLATGTLGALAGIALTGGKTGLKIAYNQAIDEPKKFILDSLAYGVGGPFALATRALDQFQGADNIPSQLAHASQPLGAMLDFISYGTNSGSYAKKSSLDKALLFTSQRFPAMRAVSTWVALDGLGKKNSPLDAAKSAAFDWLSRKHLGGGDTPLPPSSLDTMQTINEKDIIFSEAKKMLDRGGDPTELLKEGLHLKNIDPLRIGQAIRGSQILDKFQPPIREELKKNIGPEAYDLLQKRDDLLGAWADHYSIPDRIGDLLGAKAGVEALQPMGPDEQNARVSMSKTKREIQEMKNANRIKRLSDASTVGNSP